MAKNHRRHSLTPEGLSVERIEIGPEKIVAVTRSRCRTSCCPSCGHASSRIHSRYQRLLADLPAHGRPVEIMVMVRRFRCSRPSCPRTIFAERLNKSIAVASARRTARMESVVHGLGLALAVAALEDKIVQRAVIAVLNAIYEEDFLGLLNN